MKMPAALRVSQHLACALMAASGLLLGTGASCQRESIPGGARRSQETEAQTSTAMPAEPAPRAAPNERVPTEASKASAPEAPVPPARRRRYVIAALGDSLTDKRSGGGGYLDVVAEACPRSVIDNFGKGGDMVNQMRRRFEQELLPLAEKRGYTDLVLYGGVNDLYSDVTAHRTNDRIQADLTGIYAQARARGMRVVAITVSPWGGFARYFNPRRAEATLRLNAWIADQLTAGAVDRVVDSYGILSCGDAERLCPDYARRDGLHLAPEGQRILGQALLEAAFSDCE